MKKAATTRTKLSHVAPDGNARMVDVSSKPVTARTATAEGFVRVSTELARHIRANTVAKGSVLEVARLAGTLAAKRTDELIPLCHSLPLDSVQMTAALEPPTAARMRDTARVHASANVHASARVRITARVSTQSRTGVEMEALTAVAVACLTVVDMGKAVDKSMVIEGVRVLEKHGGRSGSYRAKVTRKHASAIARKAAKTRTAPAKPKARA